VPVIGAEIDGGAAVERQPEIGPVGQRVSR
jgi:hypothetical protein